VGNRGVPRQIVNRKKVGCRSSEENRMKIAPSWICLVLGKKLGGTQLGYWGVGWESRKMPRGKKTKENEACPGVETGRGKTSGGGLGGAGSTLGSKPVDSAQAKNDAHEGRKTFLLKRKHGNRKVGRKKGTWESGDQNRVHGPCRRTAPQAGSHPSMCIIS